MSRSVKKPIYKDGTGDRTRWYWRTVRRSINSDVKKLMRLNDLDEDAIIREPREIVNDYDYIDWVHDARLGNDVKRLKKLSRK
jgi:hypothetical protein